MVVNITGYQYVAHVVFIGESADSCDPLQACKLEATHLCAINEAKDFADLPVGGVNESESHGADSIVTMPKW